MPLTASWGRVDSVVRFDASRRDSFRSELSTFYFSEHKVQGVISTSQHQVRVCGCVTCVVGRVVVGGGDKKGLESFL